MTAKTSDSVTLAETVTTETSKVSPLLEVGPLFHDDPATVPVETAVAAWAVLDTMSDMVKGRQEMYRQRLFASAEKDGVKTSKGGHALWVDGSEVIREKRQEKLPNEEAFRKLLLARNITIQDAFDEVKFMQMNPSKVDYLVSSGRITQKEVDDLRKESFALKVKPSEDIEKVLDAMSAKVAALPAPKSKG